MQVLEIYRKLPKTNCGDCGESACMAFAMKVETGQRELSDCPHVEGKDRAPVEDRADTAEGSYAQTSNRLQAQLRDVDFRAAAAAIGAQYEADGDVIKLAMLNGPVEVCRNGLFEKGAYCGDSWSKLIVYDYVLRKGNAPLAGEWVPFAQFPRTPSHVKAFQKRAEAELAQVFEKNPDGVRERLEKLGGVSPPGDAKADLVCRLELLPRVPLSLQFRAADDEFPASCKLFVDRSAIQYLDIEYIARLVAKAVERIIANPV